MGSAIAFGLVQTEKLQAKEILIFDINQTRLDMLSKEHGFSIAKSYSDLNELEILIIAVKPKDISALMQELSALNKACVVISIAAGIKIAEFEKHLNENPIVRVMPNMPCQIGAGVSVLAGNDKVSDDQLQEVEEIFETIGISMVLEEDKLDAVTALSGSGPAYFFLMIEALTEAGIAVGLEEEVSEELALGTAFGASMLAIKAIEETGEVPADLRHKVTSPGGTTEAALKSLAENKFNEIITKAVQAATARSKELS